MSSERGGMGLTAPLGSLDPTDTIAAIASPPGGSARGIVRASGPDAWSIAESGFRSGHAARPGFLRDGLLILTAVRCSVPARLVLWPPGRSYTGQAMAELHMVGSPPLVRRALDDFLARGARMAEPGEFTLRAFLVGRLDLSAAEAVHAVIAAETPDQLETALNQLAGGVGDPIRAARSRIADLLAHLEALLDFADEPDVDDLGDAFVADELAAILRILEEVAGRLGARERTDRHPTVALHGPPNVGKSMLFNALAGEDRALVSPRAGTTRDDLVAIISYSEVTFELIDTAGVEEARSEIDVGAQARRAARVAAADLVLECRDDPADPPLEGPARLGVFTKSDRRATVAGDRFEVSALTGAGLDRLRREIADRLRAARAGASPGARWRSNVDRAAEAVAEARDALAIGAGGELIAIDLRRALDELGQVVGMTVADDLLDRIFRKFCIGK